MTTTSALCDIDKCPLCKKPTVYTNSKESHERIMKHVLDGKAWAQYSHACTLIDTDSPEELASNGQEALRLATLCAERGYSSAFFLLGCMYEEGNGIPISEPQALHWYKKSAKAGNAKGENTLAFHYEQQGKHDMSFRWYRKAAKQGFPISQLHLGFRYLHGKGVDASKEKAFFWFKKASEGEGNDECAHFMTGMLLYEKGDSVEAIPFLKKAASQGNEQAAGTLKEIRKSMDMYIFDNSGVPPHRRNEHERLVNLDPDSLSEKSLAISSFFRQKLEEEEVERRTNQITFVRPDGSIEGKDIAWCESNNFFQIDDNVWTGPWGRGLEDAKEYKRLHPECQKKKGRFRKVGPDTFKKIMSIKKKGNRYFGLKRYDEAVREYNKALELFPIFFEVCPLEQLNEHVNIHSNKAESLIRQVKYSEAALAATEALTLDSSHGKSLLRRAKANLRQKKPNGFDPVKCGLCEDDLRRVIAFGGDGVGDAQDLMGELNTVIGEQIAATRTTTFS